MSERGLDGESPQEPDQPPGRPRWLTVAGLVALAVVLVLVVLRLTGLAGDHGPGRHLSQTSAPQVVLGAAVPDGPRW